MEKFLRAMFQVQEVKFQKDDDFVDRLCHLYTPTLLILFTLLVGAKQYVGDAISCWVPAEFTEAHTDYVNSVCWVNGTYYVGFDERAVAPLLRDAEPRRVVSYYQWVPFILLSQCVLCCVPCGVWRALNRRVGLNLSSLIDAGRACHDAGVAQELRERTVTYVATQIGGYLRRRAAAGESTADSAGRQQRCGCRRVRERCAVGCCWFCTRTSGNFLAGVYLVAKVLYVVAFFGQVAVLDAFLDVPRGGGGGGTSRRTVFGWRALTSLLSGTADWSLTERFPRVTLCDFEVRQATNVHRYTVQCVLAVNLFNEKIFTFVYFWLALVGALAVWSLVQWTLDVGVLSGGRRAAYVRRQLLAGGRSGAENATPARVRLFVETFLRRDGVFVLRLVGHNCGEMLSADLLRFLWICSGSDLRHNSGGAGGGGGGHKDELRNDRQHLAQDLV